MHRGSHRKRFMHCLYSTQMYWRWLRPGCIRDAIHVCTAGTAVGCIPRAASHHGCIAGAEHAPIDGTGSIGELTSGVRPDGSTESCCIRLGPLTDLAASARMSTPLSPLPPTSHAIDTPPPTFPLLPFILLRCHAQSTNQSKWQLSFMM